MANHNDLKSDIRQYIYSNQNEEITGNILRDVLLEMVDSLGDGWTYKGVATTSTNPGTPDDNVFYIATAPGTYTNFGGLSVADGEVAILKYNGSWAKDVTGAATSAQVTQLGQKVDDNSENIVNLQQEIDNINPIVIEGNVTNAPDEEDLTADDNDLLKFANRSTAVNQKGYKILRKNATFAAQVTEQNTIYEIRYAFDLGGASVTIPAGCVLKFEGGMINNGTIDGNGCSVFGYRNCFRNCSISSVSNPLESSWFADDLQDALMLVEDSTLVVNCGNYTFDKDVKLRQGLIVKGDKYVKINTSHSLYLGYRTEIYGVEIVTTANHAIILDNVWVAESRTNDYLDRHGVDENNVKARVSDCSLACSSVVGTSIFYGILQPTGANMYGITIDHNRFGTAYCGIEFYNAVPYSVQSKPWSTQITISHNTLQLCLNGIYFHRIYDYSNYSDVRAFSGINIIGNGGQRRSILEDGETYSTEYFVRADSISYMQCMENMPWDFETPAYQFCIFGVEQAYIKDVFDVTVSFFGSTDLTTILSANKEPVPSSVHCDRLLSPVLPSPIDGSNYTLLDFLEFVAGTDYVINKNSTFYTQFGFVSHREGILRKRIISRYRIAVEVFFFDDSSDPTTIYNGNPTQYIGSFYTRLTDVGATRLVTAIGNIFTPIQFINNRGNNVQAYLPKGSVFYDPINANVGVIDKNSTRLYVPAFTNNGVRFSTKNDLPTLTLNDAGKVAFVTSLSEWQMWDGYTWRGLQGIYSVPSSARPSATDSGRGAIIYDVTINKAIVSNGTDWINMDGTPLLATSGTTSARPSATTAGAGYTYFDTDLGKMIVSNGSAWINMDGSALS